MRNKGKVYGGLYLIAGVVLALVKDMILDWISQVTTVISPDSSFWLENIGIFYFLGLFLIFTIGVMSIFDLGFRTTVHWSQPFFRNSSSTPFEEDEHIDSGASILEVTEEEQPLRMVPIYKAIDYITTRNWEKPIEEDATPDSVMMRLRPAMNDLRQKAFDGKITIKGQDFGFSPAVEKDIPAEYWEYNKFFLFAIFENEEGVHTDFVTTSALKGAQTTEDPVYREMSVSKSQIEKLWPPSISPSKNNAHQRIPLTEATVMAYEETQDTIDSSIAEHFHDIEGLYALAITRDGDVAVYGRCPPSNVKVRISNDDLRDLCFENNANDLRSVFHDGKHFTDLEVDQSDFEKRLKIIKKRFKEHPDGNW